MKLRPEQLDSALKRSIAPIYLLSGDEPLQIQEALDTIRTTTKQAGFTERRQFSVNAKTNWSEISVVCHSRSLFADKQLLELDARTKKLGKPGGEFIVNYCKNPSPDHLLLLIMDKLDSASQRTKWFKTLETTGVVVQVWPLEGTAFIQWLTNRMQAKGLRADRTAIRYLADLTQGNLLAAAQAIEKLMLLYGEGELTLEQIQAGASDSAKFDIFKLADAFLTNQPKTSTRILSNLRQEGCEPILILWALAKDIRTLCQIQSSLTQGQSQTQLFRQHQIWPRRQPLITQALKRFSLKSLYQALNQCANIDLIIKGSKPGNVWDSFEQLVT